VAVRDEAGRIVGMKIRRDEAASGGKYAWLSSKKAGGPSSGTHPHVPLGIKAPVETLRVTEGPIKADVATALSEVPTVAADGTTNWSAAVEVIQRLGAKTVLVALDMDRETKDNVAAAAVKLSLSLAELGIEVKVETWPVEHMGIDDLLAAGGTPDVLPADESLAYLQMLVEKFGQDDDGRPEIEIGVEEHETNDAAVEALAADQEIYQREGQLVWMQRGADGDDGIRRPEDAPRVMAIKPATLRERLSRVARFGVTLRTDEGKKFERKPVPQRCVDAVFSRGSWPGIRPLTGIVSSPVLRRDGSILNTPGYDVATRLILDPRGVEFTIPEKPTREHAIAAAERLLDLVCDFPFVAPAHRSAWFAGLLTPLARHAFDGPAPLLLFDANVRGAGKTLLAELISLIVIGADFSRMNNPTDDAECRKLITSLVLFGDTLVLIDNIVGTLGCSALDAALTGTVWKDRKLGVNEIMVGTLSMVWYASGNNVVLNGDTTRRTYQSRLESAEERPEERESFKYPNVVAHVRQNRPALLADALAILAAYCLAGRPQAPLKPWGSFEGWSRLIRQAVVWLGLPDPGETRQELAARSDSDAEHLRELIAGWEELDPDQRGLTAASALELLDKNRSAYARLRAVLADIYNLKPGELPGAKKLGRKLQLFRGRACGGKALDDRGHNRHDVKLWRVVDLANQAGSGGSAGSRGNLLARDEKPNDPVDMRTHAHAEIAVALPANPALPATETNGFHPIGCTLNGHAAHNGYPPGEIKHRVAGCNGREWWQSRIDGVRHCSTCCPCRDRLAIAAEGVLDA
jgi:hypothetical protein